MHVNTRGTPAITLNTRHQPQECSPSDPYTISNRLRFSVNTKLWCSCDCNVIEKTQAKVKWQQGWSLKPQRQVGLQLEEYPLCHELSHSFRLNSDYPCCVESFPLPCKNTSSPSVSPPQGDAFCPLPETELVNKEKRLMYGKCKYSGKDRKHLF